MNALYVTVSIPLLLVLAGFNHAHGLTTFGKTNTNGQNPPQQAVLTKQCTNQANCTLIKSTTCLKGFCLCGDNSHPVNGACGTHLKGPRHLCTVDDECVEGADCLPRKDKTKPNNSNPNQVSTNLDKICTCQEGLIEMASICGGASNLSIIPGLTLIIMALIKTLN